MKRDLDAGPETPNPAHLIEEFRAFERTLALRAAIELDVFTQVESGVNTVEALALGCGASERGVRILCDYLTVAGHLLKRSGRYALPLNSRLYLVASSPAYVGSAVRFLASDDNVQSFGQLTQAVRNGGAARTMPDEARWVGFARFMAGPSGPVAHVAAAALELTLDRPLTVLDIAAGHGLYGLAVAMRHPAAHVFALDAREVLAIAAQNAQVAGVADRYHLIPGDAFDVSFGGPYDLILMANFAHHFDAAANTTLFRKCRAALTPSGRLALIEFMPNDDRVSPGPEAAFALTMLATTSKGDAYTFRELSRMLRDAGFGSVDRPDTGDLPQCVVTASA